MLYCLCNAHKPLISAEQEIVRDIKEKLCYTALDFDKEMHTSECSNSIACTYQLPDGKDIDVNDERFRTAEVLFQPKLIGSFHCLF